MASLARKPTPRPTELNVLNQSRRRCALCFHLTGDLTEKHGQLAHLDDDPANFAEDNLAFLCLPHHSVYDSTTSQHKNYTIAEVKVARERLYQAIVEERHLRPEGARAGRKTDLKRLDNLVALLNKHDGMRFVRHAGFSSWSFNWLELEGLIDFADGPAGAEHEFIDRDLESRRQSLRKTVDAFLHLLRRDTKPTPHNPDYRAVPRAWGTRDPQRLREAEVGLRTAADLVCRIYDDLVRVGKARLAP